MVGWGRGRREEGCQHRVNQVRHTHADWIFASRKLGREERKEESMVGVLEEQEWDGREGEQEGNREGGGNEGFRHLKHLRDN